METKFKIGDRVKNTCFHSWSSGAQEKQDWYTIPFTGIIDAINIGPFFNSYSVKLDNSMGYCGKAEEHLELAEPIKQDSIMKFYKTKELFNREVTVCVAVEEFKVKTGYSVRLLEDVENVELGKKISFGRAMNSKTNLTPDIHITSRLKEKYILSAIADKILGDIEHGRIVIRGIRK